MGGNIALKDQLFAQYRSEERPVRDSVTRTNVTVSVVVSHLESIVSSRGEAKHERFINGLAIESIQG